MQIEQEQEIFLTRLRFLKPPLEVVQRRLILSISRSFLPTRENGPNFGFTTQAQQFGNYFFRSKFSFPFFLS